LVDAAVEAAASFTSPLSALILFYMHGAATRPLPTETAFAARKAQWDFDAIGQWGDAATSEQHVAWVRAHWARFQPHLLGKAYVNHLAADDRPETVRASFGENYARLRHVKTAYDPGNLFRVNANIPPV
jgi:FAD/FMN-containing dehydrogenase